MPRSPLIGLTLRVLYEKGLPADLARNRAYFDALESAGGTPLGISSSLSEPRLRELFDLCDGLCLPGGPDVEPTLYGEQTRADCAVEVDNDLDRAEMLLAEWALDADKPVLAICRGAQVLNVALGGTLWQDVGTQGATEHNHSQDGSRQELTHNIDVTPDSRLHAIAGATHWWTSTACITRRCATWAATWWSPRAPTTGWSRRWSIRVAGSWSDSSVTRRSCTSSATGRAGCSRISSPPRVRDG